MWFYFQKEAHQQHSQVIQALQPCLCRLHEKVLSGTGSGRTSGATLLLGSVVSVCSMMKQQCVCVCVSSSVRVCCEYRGWQE